MVWRRFPAALVAFLVLTGGAGAQAPERSPVPVVRPALAGADAAQAVADVPEASADAQQATADLPQAAAEEAQAIADATTPGDRPRGTPEPTPPPAERAPMVTAETLAAVIASTTIEPTPEAPARPVARPVPSSDTTPGATASAPAPEAAVAPTLRPAPRPERPNAAPEPEPAPAEASPAQVAEVHPNAPSLSQHPARRSADAFARFTQAAQRVERAPTGARPQTGSGPAAGGLCGSATLEGRRLNRITSPVQGCGVAEPVSVTAVAGVRLSQPATLDCDTARAFDRWVRHEMQPAIGNAGGGVTQIRVAAHYTCRPRNNRAGARVSEHGRGRAIDIAGFRLANGQNVSVLTDWRNGQFHQALRQMHASACGIFRTTLGPGSDGHHEDHFHFDMAQRGGGGTFCR